VEVLLGGIEVACPARAQSETRLGVDPTRGEAVLDGHPHRLLVQLPALREPPGEEGDPPEP
jgi:hypothetical protein